MTHDERATQKGHHLISADHSARLAKLHRAIAEHHETSEPRLAKLHGEIADTHEDHTAHHLARAECYGDVTAKAAGAEDELNVLHKTLVGS